VQLTCGLEARTPRVPRWHHGGGGFETRPHYGLEARTASAAHLRAGSPRTQGTSVVKTYPNEFIITSRQMNLVDGCNTIHEEGRGNASPTFLSQKKIRLERSGAVPYIYQVSSAVL
jgi:hypothetical protein